MGKVPPLRLCRIAVVCAAMAIVGDRGAVAAGGTGMAVTVVTVRSACFDDTVRLSAHVVPRNEVLVRPDVEGYHIDQITAEDGEQVHAGQKLAGLTKPDWLPELLPSRAEIKAPVDGILIIPQQLPIGTPVSARAAPPFRIVRNGEFEIDVDIPKDIIPKIRTGQSVQVETLDGADFAGTVGVVDRSVDFLTQLAHARVQIAGKPRLRDGMFATVAVDAGRDCAATVPLSAVLFGPAGPAVQVVKGNGRVETRAVQIGLAAGAKIAIRKGLQEGEIVVARSGTLLNNGDLVRPFPLVVSEAGP